MFSSGNSWYEFTLFLLIYQGMLSLMFWMVFVHGTAQCSVNCEGKNADKKNIPYETKCYACRVSFFCWENNLVCYHTATGTEIPVSSDNHRWASPAWLSILGVKRGAECTGTFRLWAPNWFLHNRHMHKVLYLQKHWVEFLLFSLWVCTALLCFFPIIAW